MDAGYLNCSRSVEPVNGVLTEFWQLAGAAAPLVDGLHASDDVLPSALATGELAVGAVAAAATSAAELAEARGSRRPQVRVDSRRVSAAFRSDQLFRLDGRRAEAFAPHSGFWPTADGWVRTHANYPHHRDRLLAALGLPTSASPDDLARALQGLQSETVEGCVLAAGGVCAAVREAAQWRNHPQAAAVAQLPLIGWSLLAEAAPRTHPRLSTDPLLPAAGLRVLDLTRVIAGPVATRTLALLGAEVLRVDSPQLPEIPWQHLDTGMGKRSALLDLGASSDRQAFDRLVDHADVVVMGYRPRALERFGLAPARLAEQRPGLVVAALSAWGPTGPWGSYRGFDSIVQAATGIALAESPQARKPGRLPAQALDHATGYLLAGAVMHAIARQIREGGSWYVHAHLARTAQWLLAHPAEHPSRLPDVQDVLRERSSPSGSLRYPPPAIEIAGGPDDWGEAGRPWGTDPATWVSGLPSLQSQVHRTP